MGVDTAALAERFRYGLRLTDVMDSLDALGRGNYCLMEPEIRPLWEGCRFWGPAKTLFIQQANEPLPYLGRIDSLMRLFEPMQEKLLAEFGGTEDFERRVMGEKPQGAVMVAANNTRNQVHGWIGGSGALLQLQVQGFSGFVTDGHCRDTNELIIQKSPAACSVRRPWSLWGRTMIAGVDIPVTCGGVLVRPGDIVGCDGDGVVVVAAEVAEDVLYSAAKLLIEDRKGRRAAYEKLGKELDETVDVEAAEAYFSDIV